MSKRFPSVPPKRPQKTERHFWVSKYVILLKAPKMLFTFLYCKYMRPVFNDYCRKSVIFDSLTDS